jgi:serine/threonine protein kinase
MSGAEPDAQLVLGRYALLHLLGRGGMGSVYLARAEGAAGFRKPVAVKLIHRHLMDDAAAVESFIREAKLAVRLDHPNIVQVLDFGQHNHQYLTVLEYLQGYSLAALCKFLNQSGRRLSIEHAAYIVYNALRGLEFAHDLTDETGVHLGLVHRDINPQNILISIDGQVTLTDFGIARIRTEATRSGPGDLKGTLAYMSPEQVSGLPVDHRSDLFSMGIVLFEVLSGERLFKSDSEAHTVMLVAQATVPSIRELRREVPAEVSVVLAQALARAPEDRYQSAADFAADVRRTMMSAPSEDIEASFKQTIRDTFENPDFVAHAGPLPDLAATLGGAPIQIPYDPVRPPKALAASRARRPKNRVRRLLGLALGVATIAALVAGGVLWGLGALPRSTTDDPPVRVVIEHQGDDAGSTSTALAPDTDAGSGVADAARSGADADRPEPLDGRLVTSTLMSRQAELLRCFDLDGGPTPRNGQVAIRLEVATDGTVRWATIEPEPAGATPMGQCLIRIATDTRFPRHPSEALIFRVPIRVAQ